MTPQSREKCIFREAQKLNEVNLSEVNSGMVLKHSVARKKLHHRQISCEGFIRDDGLWDIEAHLLDSRTYDCSYDEIHRDGLIKAGEAVHDMWLCLTIDLDFVIHAVTASSDKTPFGSCPRATDAMQELIGIKMGAGWMRLVRQKIGPRQGCTHLIDLLGPISATAYQTLHAELEKQAANFSVQQKPSILDTCLALSSDGEVVKRRWPDFYTGNDKPLSEDNKK